MRRALILLHACVLLAVACGDDEPRSERDGLVDALRGGGHVLVFRHAITESTTPEGESLRSCALQRNLSARGREQARAMGRAIRALGVPIGDVRASPMCRTRETAELAFGRVTNDRRLVSHGVIGTVADDDRRTRALRRMVRQDPGGANTVLVTHTGNIGSALGESLLEGEALVYANGRLVARVKAEEWGSR
jgi:broad specificity phosphatase PhoE